MEAGEIVERRFRSPHRAALWSKFGIWVRMKRAVSRNHLRGRSIVPRVEEIQSAVIVAHPRYLPNLFDLLQLPPSTPPPSADPILWVAFALSSSWCWPIVLPRLYSILSLIPRPLLDSGSLAPLPLTFGSTHEIHYA